eukprot:scpid70443/ scgid9106/ 
MYLLHPHATFGQATLAWGAASIRYFNPRVQWSTVEYSGVQWSTVETILEYSGEIRLADQYPCEPLLILSLRMLIAFLVCIVFSSFLLLLSSHAATSSNPV